MKGFLGFVLIVVAVFFLFKERKNVRNEEDYMLADFRYRVMLYALIMGGLVLLLQEVIGFLN